MNERERRESGGRVVSDTTFNGGGGGRGLIFSYEGSQAVPVRPSGKGILKRNKAFGSGEGREMGSGARREVEQSLTAFDRNFEFLY
jgi:hypothetical protein